MAQRHSEYHATVVAQPASDFGALLFDHLERLGVSNSELARRCRPRIDISLVSRWVGGTRVPSVASIYAVAAALELDDVQTVQLLAAAGRLHVSLSAEQVQRIMPLLREAGWDREGGATWA